MSLLAITREVSPSLAQCELSFHTREPIDLTRATAQHRAYRDCLAQLGLRVISLPAEPDLPDAVFVEDAALVFGEVVIIPIMGAPSRRPETSGLAHILAKYRPLKFLSAPGTLDGGDVLCVGRLVFVGLSQRTNHDGIDQLGKILAPYDYKVIPVQVRRCLHLKSACSYLGHNTFLVNREWIDPAPLRQFELLDGPGDEPAGANVLSVNNAVIVPASFPKTRRLLENAGYEVHAIDVSELQKAEAGVTCCSLIFPA